MFECTSCTCSSLGRRSSLNCPGGIAGPTQTGPPAIYADSPGGYDRTRRCGGRLASLRSRLSAKEGDGLPTRENCPSALAPCSFDPDTETASRLKLGGNTLGDLRFRSDACEFVLAAVWKRYSMAYRHTLRPPSGTEVANGASQAVSRRMPSEQSSRSHQSRLLRGVSEWTVPTSFFGESRLLHRERR